MKFATFYVKLQEAASGEFTQRRLSHIFEVSEDTFAPYDGRKNILFVPSVDTSCSIETSLLKGTFFVKKGPIIRGYPKIYLSTDYSVAAGAQRTERELLSALKRSLILFEEKIDGVNIRMFTHNDQLYFATRKRFNGIPREEREIRWGEVARKIILEKYPLSPMLVEKGYVPVFEVVSPVFDHLCMRSSVEDAYLIDVIRPDYRFSDRGEKEKLAETYALQVPRVIAKVDRSMDVATFNKHLRGLEFRSTQLGLEGLVAKAHCVDEQGMLVHDQVFLKLKTAQVRQMHAIIGTNYRVVDVVLEALHESEPDKGKVIKVAQEEFREDGYVVDDAFTRMIRQRYEVLYG